MSRREKCSTRPRATGFVDALTGLSNRVALQVRLEGLAGELPRLTLAVFDLDRFKAVNDSLGRDGADVALAAFVERLEYRFVAERTAGRLSFYRVGGDMFAALALDIGDLRAFGETLLAITAAPFTIADRDVYLVASVGVASGTQAENGPDLLTQAEQAMIAPSAKEERGLCSIQNLRRRRASRSCGIGSRFAPRPRSG